jgi:CubicO group peptidase (beta-lactamase class C family)
MTDLSIPALDRLLVGSVAAGELPGIAAIALDGQNRIYEGAFGVRNVETREPVELDTVFWYASMTKPLVATAAMQVVERGLVSLDQPLGDILPGLSAPQVLEGYTEAGEPILRPAKRPVTLRHLLTHTSGYGYDIWNAHIERYMRENNIPLLVDSKLASLDQPLAADPGERWEYGISIDWAGMVVQEVSGMPLEAFMLENLLIPTGMNDARFIIQPDCRKRLATVHRRFEGGKLAPVEHEISQEPEFFMGGGGIYGTVLDYEAYIRMMLNDGLAANGNRVLKPETVALMGQNHIGEIEAGVLKPVLLDMAHPTDFFPGTSQKWGLSFLINMEDSPNGRAAGSMTWAGLANSYFWIDRKKQVGGAIITQLLPFGDPIMLGLYERFEQAVYKTVGR